MSRLLSSGNGSSSVIVDPRALPASFLSHSAQDPASSWPGAPPNFAEQVVPHIVTVSGRIGTRAYSWADEALRDSRLNAEKMRTDCGVMESVEARQRAVALLNWHIEPEDSNSLEQRQLADEMSRIIRRTPDFTKLRYALADCHWYGRAGVAPQYHKDYVGGHMRTVVKRWEPRHGDKFVFRWDDGSKEYDPDQVGIRVTGGYHDLGHAEAYDFTGQKRNKIEGTQFGLTYWFDEWERKLLILDKHIIEDGPFDDPLRAGAIHGVGIRDRIYWTWYGMIECLADVLSYLERSAFGVEIWRYPAGNDQARIRCENAAKSVTSGGRTVLIVPKERGEGAEDFGVEHIEPGLGGIDAAMSVIKDYFGHKIKRYILGQTLTSEAAGTGLGSGVADAHMATFADIVKFDAVGREETLTRDFLRHLQLWNFPKSRGIWLRFVIDTESPDADRKMQGYQAAWNMGARLKEEEVLSIIGASMPKDTDRVLQNPQLSQQPMQIPGQGIEGAGQPGADSGQSAPPGSLQDMFGPLLTEMDGGQPGGQSGQMESAANPTEGGGPAQYAELGDDVERYSSIADFNSRLREALAQTDIDPSAEQKEAGNYAKGKVSWSGLTLSIENPAGSRRRPEWKPLAHHYGYINRTEGKDGDHVDVFIGPHPESELIFVIDQEDKSGHFDEHKCMLGFRTEQEAIDGYLANYPSGWNLGPVTPMSIPAFQQWLKTGDMKRAVSSEVVRYARKRQIRSSPGHQPLPSMGDANKKQHHIWREELHPRDSGGQFAEKPGAALPHQFGQGMLFHELASKLHHAETSVDPHVKSSQQQLFNHLASADVPPEQLAALLSGDSERLEALRNHAHATGQVEMPAEQSQLSAEAEALSKIYPGMSDEELESEVARQSHQQSQQAELDEQFAAGDKVHKREHRGERTIQADKKKSDRSQAAMKPERKEEFKRGDYVEYEGQSGKVYCGVNLGRENNGQILIRNENGIQHRIEVAKVVEHWNGGALAAGPKAHWGDPSLLHPSVQPPPSAVEPSKPLAGMPGGSVPSGAGGDNPPSESSSTSPAHVAPVPAEPVSMMGKSAQTGDSEGGFKLKKSKVWDAPDKSKALDTSKGQQTAFFHGLNDAPGQEKLFEGLDLAGKSAEPPAESAPIETRTPVPAAALPPQRKSKRAPAVEDFGEKIGGARKDTARPLGSRGTKKPVDESRPAWARRYEIGQIAASNRPEEEGKWSIHDTKDTDWSGQPRQKGGLFNSKEEAEKALPLLAVSRNHAVYGEKPTSDPNQTYGIFRKVTDRKRALVKGGFPSYEQAMKHMAASPESIIEHQFPDWEDYSYLQDVTRTGKEHRKGDVKTADFQKAFGFRGGEFGKWQMNQDGQTSLNHAYDGLHDLAGVLKLPSKAMSLNGELAIGFGSRGTGGKHSAKAHYEPGKSAVINLTKMKGAGSLAHEWFHALDNYIAKKAEGKPESDSLLTSRGYVHQSKLRPELVEAWKNLGDVMRFKNSTTAIEPHLQDKLIGRINKDISQHFDRIEERLASDAKYNKRHKPFTPEQQQEWDELRQKIQEGNIGDKKFIEGRDRMGGYYSHENLDRMNKLFKKSTGRSFHTSDQGSQGRQLMSYLGSRDAAKERLTKANEGATETRRTHSDYFTEAHKLDQTRVNDYYQLPHELAARAFAAYVQDKVESGGHHSQYLTAKSHNKHYALIGAKPFPEGEEREAINTAFDKLFAALKHESRADDKGQHVHLY